MDGAGGSYGRQERNVQGLLAKPGGRKPLGSPRLTWEDIKTSLRGGMGLDGLD